MNSIWIYSPHAEIGIWFASLSKFIPHLQLLSHEQVANLEQEFLNDLPACLLCLTTLSDRTLRTINEVCHSANVPLVVADQIGSDFQIGPGVIFGKTACVACFEQQKQYFPFNGFAPYSDLDARLSDTLIEQLAQRLSAELIAFTEETSTSSLRQGKLIRIDPNTGNEWQIRGVKSPICEVCSIWAKNPLEAVHL